MDNSDKKNAKFLGNITPKIEDIIIKVLSTNGGRTKVGSQEYNGLIDVLDSECGGLDQHEDIARRVAACWNFCKGVSTEMLEANTLLGEMEKGRNLAVELGKKLGEIPETTTRYFIGTETGIEDLDGEIPPEIQDKSEHIGDVLKRVIDELKLPPSDN